MIVPLLGCNEGVPSEKVSKSERSAEEVSALIAKTKENLRRIEGGSFWLGDFGVLMSDEDKKADRPPKANANLGTGLPFTDSEDNKPPRWVSLDTFYLSAYKVTYGDFDIYVRANGLPAHPPQTQDVMWQRIWQRTRTSDDVPAGVHWDQAKAYCQWLGKVSGLPFDLPTEAQWEYAASDGKNRRMRPYPTISGLLEEGKTHPTFEQKQKLLGSKGRTYPVGRFPASPSGLNDLLGNGFDWVNDWYAPDGYRAGGNRNPTGPSTGTRKVLRGSSSGEDMRDFEHLTRNSMLPSQEIYKGNDGDVPMTYSSEGVRCVVNSDSLDKGTK